MIHTKGLTIYYTGFGYLVAISSEFAVLQDGATRAEKSTREVKGSNEERYQTHTETMAGRGKGGKGLGKGGGTERR